MDNAVEYFIERTDERLGSIENKIDQLFNFKSEALGTSRVTAIIVSSVCGFISMLACGIMTYFITTHFI